MRKIQKAIIIVSILSIGSYFYTMNDSTNQATTDQIFQPADGSMKNGTYSSSNNSAKTILHNYDNVVAINGTTTTPILNPQGKYVNQQNIQLSPIGSYIQHSNNSGISNIYYLFGSISNKDDTKAQVNNSPTQTYSSSANE